MVFIGPSEFYYDFKMHGKVVDYQGSWNDAPPSLGFRDPNVCDPWYRSSFHDAERRATKSEPLFTRPPLGKQPLVQFRVRIGHRPAIVASFGIFGVTNIGTNPFQCFDHFLGPNRFDHRVLTSMEAPDRQFAEPIHRLGVSAATDRSGRSKESRIACDRIPRSVTTHR